MKKSPGLPAAQPAPGDIHENRDPHLGEEGSNEGRSLKRVDPISPRLILFRGALVVVDLLLMNSSRGIAKWD